MFRKPKKSIKTKAGLRRKRTEEVDDVVEDNPVDSGNEGHNDTGEDSSNQELLSEARKRALESSHMQKRLKASNVTTTGDTGTTSSGGINGAGSNSSNSAVMHQYATSGSGPISQKDLATRTNEYHPTKVVDRGNKFLAGPIKAPTNIRTTCRFDYQPDVCKDYKDTGFCGFGDSCIYLHERGDTLSGWQLEQKWQEEQELKKKRQKEQMEAFISGNNKEDDTEKTVDDDGLPFACYLCRDKFTEPVVTNCGHYFCQDCLLQHIKESSNLCPGCDKDTHGVFHEPTKLLSKKRKVSGRDSTWKEFQEACRKASNKNGEDTDEF